MELSAEEQQRYSRHLLLPEFAPHGQERLKAASVLCVGAGGLGSAVTVYLAAAGVGRLGVADADRVELSNLQRQVLHSTTEVGEKKLDSARRRLAAINPHVVLEPHDTFLNTENAAAIIARYDLVIDGTDNYAARLLLNEHCVALRKPLVHGSVRGFEGQCSVFAPHLGSGCYRCILPEVPSGKEVFGVLGALPGIIGSLQAMEAVKLIVGVGEPLLGRLLYFDARRLRFKEFVLRRDPRCPVCAGNKD